MKYWHISIDKKIVNDIIDGKLKTIKPPKNIIDKIKKGDRIILHLKECNIICDCDGKSKGMIKIIYIRTQNKWIVNIKEPWYTFIKDGKKVVEGRLNKGKFMNIKKGDIVFFQNKLGIVMSIVLNIEKYKTFKEYLKKEGLDNTLPDIKTIKDGEKIYYKYYSKKDEKELGVLAIHIKKIYEKNK